MALPRVYFDIDIAGQSAGRVTFEVMNYSNLSEDLKSNQLIRFLRPLCKL